MFINTSSNRQIVKEMADRYDLNLVEPEIFIRFLSDDMYISTWDDVQREMIQRGRDNFSMRVLQRQYKECARYLYNGGYTNIDMKKL